MFAGQWRLIEQVLRKKCSPRRPFLGTETNLAAGFVDYSRELLRSVLLR